MDAALQLDLKPDDLDHVLTVFSYWLSIQYSTVVRSAFHLRFANGGVIVYNTVFRLPLQGNTWRPELRRTPLCAGDQSTPRANLKLRFVFSLPNKSLRAYAKKCTDSLRA